MLKRLLCCLCALFISLSLTGCGELGAKKKIAASFGVGAATRWSKEKVYMEQRAKELGVDFTAHLNSTGSAEDQIKECMQLIDQGISVLIIMPKDPTKMSALVDYAHSRNVKIIAYARPIINQKTDLFIGYDNYRIGQTEGLYAVEMVHVGNFIILKGDSTDNNALELYQGIMKQVQPAENEGVKIILDEFVPGWSPAKAKEMVRAALLKNNKKIDAILAPNDKIAASSIEVLTELNIKNKVIVTGMDAELAAVKRIIAGSQSMTVYLDLKELAYTAIDQAVSINSNKKFSTNAEFKSKNISIPAHLVSGKVVTKENIDKVLIDTGVYTYEQVYGIK